MDSHNANAGPHLTLVMPCYNEEAVVRYTIQRLIAEFEAAGHRLEIVAVNNGSTDSTPTILQEMAATLPGVVYHHVEVNQGYGNGLLSGLPKASGQWIGFIPADGQVDAQDVVRLYEVSAAADRPVLGKVRRRFRMDGLRRKVVSTGYNVFVRLLWPRLESLDINGTPKILPREVIARMGLKSRNWLLDPEIMIKAHYMGIRVLEFSVFARMRGGGTSHVRAATIWEFVRSLLVFRFSSRWKADFRRAAGASEAPSLSGGTEPFH